MSGQQHLANLRLWQLISPALPVGAYAYSGGMEYAIEAGWLNSADNTLAWIRGLMQHNLGSLDVPVLQRCYVAWQQGDEVALENWSRFILAARESAELKAEDQQLGRALATLLSDLDIEAAQVWRNAEAVPFVCPLALAGVSWGVGIESLASGLLWSWCENQVAAAIKLVPLGQTAGQKMLLRLAELIPDTVVQGLRLADDSIGALAPGLAIASARHETQYTRLFRS